MTLVRHERAARRRRPGPVAGACGVAAALLLPSVTAAAAAAADPAASADGPLVLDVGQVTAFDVSVEDDRPALGVVDRSESRATGELRHDPEDVVLAVGPGNRTTLPEPTGAWAFLSEHGGSPAWVVHQAGPEGGGLHDLAWDTRSLPLDGSADAGSTTVRLDIAVEGPGDVLAFEVSGIGGPGAPLVDTGSRDSSTVTLPVRQRSAATWVFTAPGEYALTVTPTLDTPSGPTTGEPETYTVLVQAQGSGSPAGGQARAATAAAGPTTGPAGSRAPGTGPTPTTSGAGGSTSTTTTASPATTAGEVCRLVTVTPGTGGGPGTSAIPVSEVSDGHFDLGAQVRDGDLEVLVKDDRRQPAQWVDPASLVFRLGDAARAEVPADPAFAFLGAPGDPIWSVGQVQQPGVPWLGWNTQHESVVGSVDGAVTFTLDSVDGPGELGVYATGTFGGVGARYFGTLDGFPDATAVPLNQHVHGNWTFTDQGLHRVTMTLSATLRDGSRVSDTAVLTFAVGDAPGVAPGATSTTATGGGSSPGQPVVVGRTDSGEECELPAAGGGPLAFTGTGGLAPLAATAAGLLAVGTALVLARRRRQDAPQAAPA